MTLLEIRNLGTEFRTSGTPARAVDGISFSLEEGEAVGLVGESGSGKTALALSLLGLLPRGQGFVQEGSSVRLRGEELVGMGNERLRRVRGKQIAMIFQEPMSSLNPVFTIGDQIGEAVRLHKGWKGRRVLGEVERLLAEVGIGNPGEGRKAYPHQLSGGMRQRAMVAMALAGEPSLLVADEPTTALDVTVGDQILDLLHRLQSQRGMALLLISHDPGVVARVCSRVVVLYAGRLAEIGPTREVLEKPVHPYTRGLLGARLSLQDRRTRLRPIRGDVPDASAWPGGCRFHPRCPEAFDRCRREEPRLEPVGEAPADLRREAACWLLARPGGDSE